LISLVLFFLARGQTPWPEERWFELSPRNDGRLETWIRGFGYPEPVDGVHPYKWTYRNSIGLDTLTGQLLIAFGVSEQSLAEDGHIMAVTLESGEEVTGPPRNVTDSSDTSPNVLQDDMDWIDDNMILWFDEKEECMVMLYQIFSSETEDDSRRRSTSNHKYQYIFKKTTCDGAETWTEPTLILSEFEYPHIQYPIVESLVKDAHGFAQRLLLPVHHLDMTSPKSSYQMATHPTRDLSSNLSDWIIANMSESSSSDTIGGYIQATVVRPGKSSPYLVAFERDAEGYYLRRTTSADDGYTWTNPVETPIPNPALMSQAIGLHNGLILLLYNPQESFGTTDPANRPVNSHHLVAALSEDSGLTWSYSRPLEYAYDSMFLYPYGIQDPTCDNIYLSYSVQTDIGDQSCGAFFDFMNTTTTECTARTTKYGEYVFPQCDGIRDGDITFRSDEDAILANECYKRAFTASFIKFTILHESWIRNNHDWSYDTEGCTWQIPESLQNTTPEGFISQSEVELVAEETETQYYAIALLSTGIVFVLLIDLMCFCRRREKEKSQFWFVPSIFGSGAPD